MVLYCSAADISRCQLPWQFVAEQLAEHFNIPDSRRLILSSILESPDTSYIEDILERENLMERPVAPTVVESDGNESSSDAANDDDVRPGVGERPGTHQPIPRMERTSYFDNANDSGPTTPPSLPLALGPNLSNTSQTGRRSSYRANIIDETGIIASAEALETDDVRIVGPRTPRTPDSIDDGQEEGILPGGESTTSRLLMSSRLSLHSPSPRPRSSARRDVFRMSDLAAALPASPLSRSEQLDVGTSSEHEIGYGGELFVRS